MTRAALSLVLLLTTGAVAADVPPKLAPARQAWSHYQLIVDRNIFTRTHSNSNGRSRGTPVTVSIAAPAHALILSGTALLAQDRVAFLENTAANTTIRAHEGDTTEFGRLTAIGVDQVRLSDGQHQWTVKIGSRLDGASEDQSSAAAGATASQPAAVSSSSPPVTLPPTSTAPPPAASSGPAPASADEAAMMERMRQRRLQELNR